MRTPHHLSLPPDRLSFTVSDALEAGVSRRRLRAGDLQHPFWGVRAPNDHALTVFQRCRAFELRMPTGAFFSHGTAGILQTIPLPFRIELDEGLDIGTGHARRPVDAAGIRGHRMQILGEEVMNWVGLPVTRPERTLFDLAPALTLHELVAAGDYLIHWRRPMTTSSRLAAAFARYPGRRGRVKIRQALALLNERAESPAESRLRMILLEAGLPAFDVNRVIRDAYGQFIGRVDLVNTQYRLILEYEGDQHRTDPAQWAKDLNRVARLQDEGWRVIRVSAGDLRAPGDLIARIRRHIARTVSTVS